MDGTASTSALPAQEDVAYVPPEARPAATRAGLERACAELAAGSYADLAGSLQSLAGSLRRCGAGERSQAD